MFYILLFVVVRGRHLLDVQAGSELIWSCDLSQ